MGMDGWMDGRGEEKQPEQSIFLNIFYLSMVK